MLRDCIVGIMKFPNTKSNLWVYMHNSQRGPNLDTVAITMLILKHTPCIPGTMETVFRKNIEQSFYLKILAEY